MLALVHGEDFGLAPGTTEGDSGNVAYRFFALPAHHVVDHPTPLPGATVVEPEIPPVPDVVERAFLGAEFRDLRARDRVRMLLADSEEGGPHFASPDECGPSAIFAQPPNDLPALLRLADQLEHLAARDSGEKALVWRCHCGTRYAVPVALVRQVSIRCERCGLPVELSIAKSLGEEALLAPTQGAINATRKQLAAFFREAMARGWPVLVCATQS